MLFKYKGADKENKRVTGYIEATDRDDAMYRIKNTTNVIVLTELKETINNPLINPIREQVSGLQYKIGSMIVDQREKSETSKLEKERQKIQKKRDAIYNPEPPQESFKAVRELISSTRERVANADLLKRKPPIQDEETVLDTDAYYELLDMFKERENAFNDLSLTGGEPIQEKQEEKMVVDWSLIEPDEGASNIQTERRFKVKVKADAIIMMTRRLQIMLNAGVSLVNGLIILSDDENEAMKLMLEKIIEDIQMGNSFSSALNKFPDQFDNTYISLVAIGETSGNLSGALLDVINNMEQRIGIQKQMKSAAIYPSIIGAVLGVVVVLASIFFIPAFEEIIMDITGGDMPAVTRIVFGASKYIPGLAVALIGSVFVFKSARKRSRSFDRKVRELTSRLALTLPVIGPVTSIYQMNNFASTVSLMLRNGVRLSESLILAQQSSNNVFIKSGIAQASLMMVNGFSLSEGLSKQAHFDKILINIVLIGEETGEMSFALDEIAKFYEEELTRKIEDLMSMVQPISILLIGVLAIPAIIAIYLPILNMSSGA